MELFWFAFGGFGFILVGAHEAFLHASPNKNKNPSSLFWISVLILSSLFVVNSTVSLVNAHNSNDAVGTALQLQLLPIAFIFIFYSLLPLLQDHVHVTLPSSLVGLVAFFAFVQEFLLFYLQRKDSSGIENRYYDLLLVPIAICVFSTLIHLLSPHSNVPKLGRAVGLILHGTWLLQMGLSLFSGWVAQGCSLHRVSRGNYTLRCKGHPEYHRARAIATLQFNCHLALMVLLLVAAFSFISARNGLPLHSSSTTYAPLGAQLHRFDNNSQNFTLDSDDDNDGDDTKEDKVLVVGHAVNAS